jgi:glycosyltransferase involved in cell wall biosynthesis
VIALDATYSLGRNLSGVGVYSREILFGLAQSHPREKFLFYYRPHRFLRSWRDSLPGNSSRRILRGVPRASLFHALNQRVDERARRTVVTFHDLFVMTGDYSSPEFRVRFTQQARQAAERSDMIITISQFTANQVTELLHVEPARIRVIHHGTRLPGGFPADRKSLILTVGAIQKRKNIARLVKAFERTPPGWRLAIAGAADGYGAAEELSAIEISPRRAEIDVLGYVSGTQLESLYNQASVFAFPSLDEGFGMPVLDAMSHGIPVLASRRSAIPEVTGDAALLVDPENVEQLGEALSRLTTDPALRQDLTNRGRTRAAEFPWTAAVDRTWAVYDELRSPTTG